MDSKVPWSVLSEELWMGIFSGLNITELGIAARVCKQWNRLASDERLWKARFDAKWSSGKKLSEISWRSECKRFLHHIPSVESAVHEAGPITHLTFSKDGEFFLSCSNTGKISVWKTDPLQFLHTHEGDFSTDFIEFNDTGKLFLVAYSEWQGQSKYLVVYHFDPTMSAEGALTLVDFWNPGFPGFETDSISWLDSDHYLVATNIGQLGCFIQVNSAARPMSFGRIYQFEDIECRMLLAAEIPSEGSSQKILVFSDRRQLDAIYIKRMTDSEDTSLDRPTEPDHCITMEGPVMGIALMADKKTLIVNCRTNNDFYCQKHIHSKQHKLQIQLVDLVTLRKLAPHPLLGHVSDENVCASLPISSGSLIACKSSDRFVYIFDTEYNCCLERLSHGSGIDALAWNPADAEMLLTASEGKIRLWKSRNRASKKKKN